MVKTKHNIYGMVINKNIRLRSKVFKYDKKNQKEFTEDITGTSVDWGWLTANKPIGEI